MKPTLSVALCTYNGEKYFQKQLDSIIQQLLKVDEIIICDDGSTDNTIEIAQKFKESHKEINIQIFQNDQNIGVICNFEKAISKCTGDIIFLSDQDDIWMKNKTKVIADFFLRHDNIDLVFTDAALIDEKDCIISQYSLLDAVRLYGNCLKASEYGFSLEMINQGNRCTGATMAIRKALRNEILPFNKDINALHDEQLAIFCAKKNSIAVITRPLIHYRLHRNNTIGIGEHYNHPPKEHHFYEKIFLPFAVKDSIRIIKDCNDTCRGRVNFINYRHNHYNTIWGKIILVSKLFSYIKYYRSYFLKFYISDITLDLKYLIRNALSK